MADIADEMNTVILGLRAQLQAAQEERDAAIERVGQAERRLGLEVLAHKETERDAKAKGALAETRLEHGLWALDIIKGALENGVLAVSGVAPTEAQEEAPR